jgi:hypothetical protein
VQLTKLSVMTLQTAMFRFTSFAAIKHFLEVGVGTVKGDK